MCEFIRTLTKFVDVFQRRTGYAVSDNPFFNFYNAVGRKGHGNARDAARLWNEMSDGEKETYRAIAKEEKRLKRLHRNRNRENER
uniref:HMG box domain-containing protein n=1 Tax=Glossina palpalis gambiensis TaxID=67801 RepID=A0A1B0AL41_9MUSC